jgi:hypothetical protein
MSRPSPIMRRYVRRIAAATACYLAFLFLAVRLVGTAQVTGPLAIMLAVLPALAVLGMFWAVARLLVEQTDEYLRTQLVGQILVATALTLSVTTVYGFLENFRLVPHVDAFYIAVLWFVGLGVGAVVNALGVRGQAA